MKGDLLTKGSYISYSNKNKEKIFTALSKLKLAKLLINAYSFFSNANLPIKNKINLILIISSIK